MWEDELFDEIQVGDKVWYENPQGQTHKAKAVMQGPAGWVCDRGNGQPVVINEGHNYLGHKKARKRKPDHLGEWLFRKYPNSIEQVDILKKDYLGQ